MTTHRLSSWQSTQQPILFFGTFNPFHQGHWGMITAVLQQEPDTEVIVIPSANPPNRLMDDSLASPENRLAMIQQTLDELKNANHPLISRVHLSDMELAQAKATPGIPSYTINTLMSWAECEDLNAFGRLPKDCIRLLMGGDTLASLPQWKAADALAEQAHIYLAERPSHTQQPLPKEYPSLLVTRLALKETPVSASQIRRDLANGLTPPGCFSSVLAYCQSQQLFGSQPIPTPSTLHG